MNENNLLMTDHMIDDHPEWVVNLGLFHMMSRFSHLNCTVSPDGQQHEYLVSGGFKRLVVYEAAANLTIKTLSLPLIADIDEVNCKLIVKYSGK